MQKQSRLLTIITAGLLTFSAPELSAKTSDYFHTQTPEQHQTEFEKDLKQIKREKEKANFVFSYEEWIKARLAYETWLSEAEHILVKDAQPWREQCKNPENPDWKLLQKKANLMSQDIRKVFSLLSPSEKYDYFSSFGHIETLFKNQYLSEFYNIEPGKNLLVDTYLLYLDREYERTLTRKMSKK